MSTHLSRVDWQTIIHIKPEQLTEQSIHLWWADLNISLELAQRLKAVLTPKQLEKVARFPSEEMCCRYIAGRAYLKLLLGLYLGKDNVELKYNQYGKPALADSSTDISFNYTDTKGKGVFCFSKNTELGIDIESFNRQGNFERIVERRFSEKEKKYLKKNNGEEVFSNEFIIAWTRKEAFGKALGVGLNYALRDHDLYTGDQTHKKFKPFIYKYNNSDWLFQQLMHEVEKEQFVVCLVSKGAESKQLITRQFVGQDALNSL